MQFYRLTFLLLFFFMASLLLAFDQIGSPKSVHCSAYVLLAENPITERTDINDLIETSTEISINEAIPNPSCSKYEGDRSGTCSVTLADDELFYVRYHFNTQNGGIEVMDRVTGLSAWSAWTQQHRVTKSGYLTAEVWLTSEAGGLGGNPKAFRIEVRCQAFGDDWK